MHEEKIGTLMYIENRKTSCEKNFALKSAKFRRSGFDRQGLYWTLRTYNCPELVLSYRISFSRISIVSLSLINFSYVD